MSERREASLRATAELQAQRLQAQARLQDEVLDAILELVDLPSRYGGSPLQPESADLDVFKRGVSLFRCNDFDDLVKERNIYEKCGYCLCSELINKVEQESTHRILWATKGGQDLKVVPNDASRKWCSKRCENLALFVRKQLSNEPAWERRAVNKLIEVPHQDHYSTQADLLPEEDHEDDTDANRVTERLGELSLERGDVSRKREPNIIIFENETEKPVDGALNIVDGDEIEGYHPKARIGTFQAGSEDSDDGEDILDI